MSRDFTPFTPHSPQPTAHSPSPISMYVCMYVTEGSSMYTVRRDVLIILNELIGICALIITINQK